jgi:hypothetical protein
VIVTTRPSKLFDRYSRFVEPRDDDLPRLRLLLAFPALLVFVGVVLVGIGLNGSSSGALWSSISSGQDPDLLAGTPQPVRSDEWNVSTVWTIAQLQQGLPERNQTFPGGMDAALPYDLPRLDWSIVFRPHQVGYLLLDVDHATAWRWWSMGLTLMAAAYVFLLTVLPRRPGVAAVLSIGFFCSPFFQWWYQSTTFWPVVWGLVVMAALTWSVKSRGRFSGWAWAPFVAFYTIVMAMGIYAPFIIPIAIVVLGYGLGLVVERVRRGQRFSEVLLRVVPTFASGTLGAAVTGAWLLSKSGTVESFLGTVYPGARFTSTGDGGILSAARTIGSSFTDSLKDAGGFLGINSSEASTFLLTGAFLAPIVVWAAIREHRAKRALPWAMIGLVVVLAIFVAYTIFPGWDAGARLLLLDRTTQDRARIGVGLASFTLLVLVVRYMDDAQVRPSRWFAGGVACLFLLSQVALAGVALKVFGTAAVWGAAPFWWLYAAVSAAAIYFFSRRRIAAGAAVFVLVSVASAVGVNPVYVGVLDLRDTPVAEAIIQIDESDQGTWLGVGDLIVPASLVESGVEAFNGTQGSPSLVMWKQIDPSGQYEYQWNRIGGVRWMEGVGEPVVSNPYPDQIESTFDACSVFAQAHVDHVLSSDPLTSPCLDEVARFDEAATPLAIYSVITP